MNSRIVPSRAAPSDRGHFDRLAEVLNFDSVWIAGEIRLWERDRAGRPMPPLRWPACSMLGLTGGGDGRYSPLKMRTLLPDPPPDELRELLERRRSWGADLHDEVWEGVLHVVPAPDFRHATISAQVAHLLAPPAAAAGLTVTDAFNLGDSKQDFRVPDAGLHRPGAGGTWLPTAALAVEIVSPGDETWAKLPFYAAHEVDELLIVDPSQRRIDWLGLKDGQYEPMQASGLIAFGPTELAQHIDWV